MNRPDRAPGGWPAEAGGVGAPPGLSERSAAALPTFLMIGATKCGTTSLHDWLSRHRQVYMHPHKEMRFFLDEGDWHRGLAWYARQFEDRGTAVAWGEASNGYARSAEYPGAPERIAASLPRVRLLYVVREPMARLVSHYRHRLATGREWRGPEAAVRADRAYVETGLYGSELQRWLAHIDRERLLVVPFEGLVRDPALWLDRVAAHLGVDPMPDLPLRTRNAATGRQVLPRPLRRLSAVPALRAPLRRIAPKLAAMLPGGRRPSEVAVDLPDDLRAALAARFAADRPLLERLAGPEITEHWT